MLLDLDYFFAQCEELRNPALKTKPVVVCVYSGRTEESGAVSTSNYLAREYGVKSGMPIFIAKKKLQDIDAVFLPVDYDYYEEMSQRIMSLAKTFADRFEQVGIDEAYLDVTERVQGDFDEASAFAQELKREIKEKLGFTCSVGVAPNKLVAKIAADIQKPDGLTVIKPGRVQSFLNPLPVGRLPGIGIKTREKMQVFGISTVEDLAEYDVQSLISQFGRSLGNYFHNASAGIDDDPVQQKTETESISRIATLKENTREPSLILEKTDSLCEDVHSTLLQQGFSFRTVGIAAVMVDMSMKSRSKTLENPTTDLVILKATLKELLQKLLEETDLKVRRIGVRVSSFEKEHKKQRPLTTYFSQEPQKKS